MFSLFPNKKSQARFSRVEITLILILLIFGIPMIVLIPPGAGYDEEDHLVRVWEISAFSLLPGEMSPQQLQYPTVFRDFAYRQQGSAGVIDSEFWQSFTQAALYERGFVRREIDTKSVYSPALLLPQGVAMRLFGRSADLPALPAFYLSRLAGLLSYLALTWLAVRLMPFGKWILLVLALSPMALFQAATLSPDTISNGIGFLFIAGCLRVTQDLPIAGRQVGSLILLIFLLFLAKLNLVPLVLLPFLLVLPSRFSSKRLYVLLVALTLILFVVEVAGWNWIASRNFDSLLLEEANPAAQIGYILTHPFGFLQTVLKDLAANGSLYLQGWLNGYGYYYWTPPLIISLLFLLSLGIALLSDSTSGQVDRRSRMILVLVFLASYVATIASLYISFTPVGAEQVFGVQGRYFIPLVLPLALVLASFSPPGTFAAPKWLLLFLITALSMNLLGLFLSFHIPCGSTYYQTGLCYRPLFREFPSNVHASPPIIEEKSFSQEVRVACDGLTEVRVWLMPSAIDDPGRTRFILEEASGQRTLLDTSIANADIPQEMWYPLRFDPDWRSAGKQYVLKILSEDSASGAGLHFYYTPQPEFNLGNSYEDRQLLEEDILLQYGCATGWRKIWLTGKP